MLSKIGKDVERVEAVTSGVYASAAQKCDELLAIVQPLLESVSADGGKSGTKVLNALVKSITKPLVEAKSSMTTEFKDLQTVVGKLSTTIDKTMLSNLESTSKPGQFEARLLNELIVDTLLRQGRFEIAASFIQECGGQLHSGAMALKDRFVELHKALDALRFRDVQPALAYLSKLDGKSSGASSSSSSSVIPSAAALLSLEFELRRLAFLQLIAPPLDEQQRPSPHLVNPLTGSGVAAAALSSGAGVGNDHAFGHGSGSIGNGSASSNGGSNGSGNGHATRAGGDSKDSKRRTVHMDESTDEDGPVVAAARPSAAVAGVASPARLKAALSASASSSTAAATPADAATRQKRALEYARTHFPRFAVLFPTDVQRLMGCFVFIGDLLRSPYAHLFRDPEPVAAAAPSASSQFSAAAVAAGAGAASKAAASASAPSSSGFVGLGLTPLPGSSGSGSGSSSGGSSSGGSAVSSSSSPSPRVVPSLRSPAERLSSYRPPPPPQSRGSDSVSAGPSASSSSSPIEGASALWERAEKSFAALCFQAMGVPQKDPLAVSFAAADIALPKTLRFQQMMSQHSGLISSGDLPSVDVDLGREYQYHSTFVCPVTKTQTTGENPPVLLKCGHVISRDAMDRISRTTRAGRFKCPTCPSEQSPAETMTIFF